MSRRKRTLSGYGSVIFHYYRVRLALHAKRLLRRHPFIAIERAAGIGDIIATFPAVLGLRKKYPDACIAYATSAAFSPVARLARVADVVVEIDGSGRFPQYRRADYDLVLQPRTEDEEPTGRVEVHFVDDFARRMDVQHFDRKPRLHVTPALCRGAAQQKKQIVGSQTGPLVALHPGPSWNVKMWPATSWEILTTRLKTECNAHVVQLGANYHTELGHTSGHRIAGTTNLVGRLTLAETVAFIEQCDLVIGIDSGMAHIAGAVSTPCVGIFGPVHPALRLVRGTPALGVTLQDLPCIGCHHRVPVLHWRSGCPNTIACMNDLPPESVFAAARQLLNRGRDS